MPIQRPEYQLMFDLEIDEEVISDQSSVPSPEEIRLRSMTALNALEHRTDLKWFEEYNNLRDGGWPWRVAAYIAWASSPKMSRIPKNQDELARQFLGLTSDRAIATWRKKNGAIDEMIAILQSAPLWQERSDQFDALNEGARKAGTDYKYFPHLKLAMEMRNDYIPSSKITAEMAKKLINSSPDDLEDLTDDELRRIDQMARTALENKHRKDGEE